MPEQFLHDFDVRPVGPQKGRIRVPEGVPPNVFGDSQLNRQGLAMPARLRPEL